MKILIKQFLGKWHSWSVTGWGLADSLISQGHTVHLFSTDGIEHLPKNLHSNLIGYTKENDLNIIGRRPDNDYDCQVSYTCIKNFPHMLNAGNKNRIGMWLWEWKNGFPTGFAKHHLACDYLVSPSQFGKQIFTEAGIPESKIVVIPHGINKEQYSQNTKMELPTKKKYKILANIAQNHLRKNIPGLLTSYGKAFTNKDDVCLILKAKERPLKQSFDVSLNNCLRDFYQQFPKHAELKVYSEFINDMSLLYRSVDSVFTMSKCEGFYLPGSEALCSSVLNISPNFGGQLDFLNDSNALLISGKEVRADPKSMYWESKPNATWFEPSIDDAVDKLKYSYQNYESINSKLELQRNQVLEQFDWNNIARQFTNLCI